MKINIFLEICAHVFLCGIHKHDNLTILNNLFVFFPLMHCKFKVEKFFEKERSGRLATKVFLIGTDSLAKHRCNYNLISRQLAESNIPFNTNNLTLYKNPLRTYFKGLSRCWGRNSRAPLLSPTGGH